MRGIFRLRALSAKHWDYYYTAHANRNRSFANWGIVRISGYQQHQILREPIESFVGEGELLILHGTRFLASHLLKGKHVW